MKKSTEDALCLMGGALLGAAAMYLLDPETGERRRHRLAAAAENAYGSARDSIGEGWHRLADRTGDWSESASDYTHGLAAKAGGIASGLAASAGGYLSSGKMSADEASERAGKWGSSLKNRAHDVFERARDAMSGHGRNGRRWFGHFTGKEEREGFGPLGITSTALTCCAVGAGLMYFMDPQRGRYRRHWIADKATHFARSTGKSMRATGRNLANRFRGTAYQAAHKAREMTGYEGQVDSEQLVNRIRSGMGHVISSPSQVQIMADANGIVTLTGNIPATECEVLCATVRGIPGVMEVVNRLDTSPPTSAEPRNQSNKATSRR